MQLLFSIDHVGPGNAHHPQVGLFALNEQGGVQYRTDHVLILAVAFDGFTQAGTGKHGIAQQAVIQQVNSAAVQQTQARYSVLADHLIE